MAHSVKFANDDNHTEVQQQFTIRTNTFFTRKERLLLLLLLPFVITKHEQTITAVVSYPVFTLCDFTPVILLLYSSTAYSVCVWLVGGCLVRVTSLCVLYMETRQKRTRGTQTKHSQAQLIRSAIRRYRCTPRSSSAAVNGSSYQLHISISSTQFIITSGSSNEISSCTSSPYTQKNAVTRLADSPVMFTAGKGEEKDDEEQLLLLPQKHCNP